MSEKRERARRRLGIRPKLVAYLAIFTVLMLVVVWVCQIRLLSYFYEREKFSELDDAAMMIEQSLGDAGMREQIALVANEKMLCVRLFEVGEVSLTPLYSADGGTRCIIHNMMSDTVEVLYEKALQNDGVYDRRMDFESDELVRESARDRGFQNPYHGVGNSANAISARILESGEKTYLLLLDCELTPVSATVNTLRVQFMWISALLLGTAVLFALVLYRVIVTPLSAITEKAARLAEGDFDTDFRGKGYREVQELGDTLQFAARELGTADRLQKELIANISHDLRTPLTMIKGYGEMMRDLPGENNADNAQIIIDETTRLTELVADLLDLSKLQSGAEKLKLEPLDLAALARETLTRYDALVKSSGYRILLDAEGEAPVLADRTMILQVIYNLINNAVNYTGEDLAVRVSVRIEGERVLFSVSDSGEGIEPELLDSIWDRYYRVDKVHKRAVMGTGLGLSIVKGVLERHGADYGVESEKGKGSRFWFALPLVKNAEEAL